MEQLHGQAPAAARPREHRAAGAGGADGRTSAGGCWIFDISDDLSDIYIYINIYIYIWASARVPPTHF